MKQLNDFTRIEDACDLPRQDILEILNVTDRAMQNWRAGRNDPPQSTVLLLKAIGEKQISLEWLVNAMQEI